MGLVKGGETALEVLNRITSVQECDARNGEFIFFSLVNKIFR